MPNGGKQRFGSTISSLELYWGQICFIYVINISLKSATKIIYMRSIVEILPKF